jgi:hypothetical protein
MSTINEDSKDNAAVSRNKDFHGGIHQQVSCLMQTAETLHGTKSPYAQDVMNDTNFGPRGVSLCP